jgi:hypothetical protein
MSARDKYHDAVKHALVQEGWTITHDPYRLTIGRRRGYIDLGAEMPIAAEKEGRRIAVEVKSFLGTSELDDLENALGQFGSIASFWRNGTRNGFSILPCRTSYATYYWMRPTFGPSYAPLRPG